MANTERNIDCESVSVLLLAIDLKIKVHILHVIKTKLKSGAITAEQGLTWVMQEWIKQTKGKCTLSELSPILSSNDLTTFEALAKEILETKQDVVDRENPTIKALSNIVIMDKLMKNLNYSDQTSLSLIRKSVYYVAMPYWRKTRWLNVHIVEESQISAAVDTKKPGITLQELIGLSTSKESNELLQLIKYPYRKYVFNPTLPLPNNHPLKEYENSFCSLFQSSVRKLRITNVNQFESVQISSDQVVSFVLDTFSNLEGLSLKKEGDIIPNNNTAHVVASSSSLQHSEYKKAKKNDLGLKSLTLLSNFHTGLTSAIMYQCPNLTSLKCTNASAIEQCLNDDNAPIIQLKKFVVLDNESEKDHSSPNLSGLLKYSRKLSNSIQKLRFDWIQVDVVSSNPFELYQALARLCSLKTIKIEYDCSRTVNNEIPWINEYCYIKFPMLANLHLTFSRYNNEEERADRRRGMHHYPPKFNFNALRCMPNIQNLKIEVLFEYRERDIRSDVAGNDWININVPPNANLLIEKLGQTLLYSSLDPIICNNLKVFYFNGFKILNQDVEMLEKWFPNLLELNALLDRTAMKPLLKAWTNSLKSMHVLYGSSVLFSQLCKLKRTRVDLCIKCDEKIHNMNILLLRNVYELVMDPQGNIVKGNIFKSSV